MKNNKGQVGVSGFIMIAITAIVGVILLLSSAQNIHQTVNTEEVLNYTIAIGANGTTVSIPGAAVSGTLVAYNTTDSLFITAANYSISNRQVVDGVLTARLLLMDAEFNNANWNLSYTSEPEGYATNSGTRAIANIIIIFFGLSIAVVVLIPTLKSKILDMVGK